MSTRVWHTPHPQLMLQGRGTDPICWTHWPLSEGHWGLCADRRALALGLDT